MFVLDYLASNWELIFGFLTALYAAAVAGAKLTPTQADDEFLASLYAKFGALSAFIPIPRISTTAKAIVAADKAALVLDKAAADAAAKASAAETAKAASK